MRSTSWFDRGEAALRRVVPGTPSGYACPICRHLIPREDIGLLSIEHVPPKAVGGAELVLTCRRCNSHAGSAFDVHAARQDKLIKFHEGATVDMNATLTVSGAPANVDLKLNDGSIQIFGRSDLNSPTDQAAWEAALHELVGATSPKLSFGLPAVTHIPWRASVSWLRAAYLVVFAALGYRFAIHERLSIVREQILNPEEKLIRVSGLFINDASPDERICLVVLEPVALQCVFVQFGRRAIMLPAPWSDVDIYGQMADSVDVSAEFSQELAGKLVPWPTSPQHLYD